MFTINADKEYAFVSKNKRQVFIRICCLAIGGTTFIVTMFVCKQTHAKIYAKISFFPPSTTGLPNLARDVYVSFYLFRLSPMAVGIGLGWAPPIGLPPPKSRGVVNPWPITSVIHWRFFFAGEPESEHAFGHFINLSVHQGNDSMRSVDKSALAFPLQWVAVCHTPPGFPPCRIVMKN